jgi:hypothetical protein
MQRLFKWLARKISPDKAAPKSALRRAGDKRMPQPQPQPVPKPVRQPRPKTEPVGYAAEVGGKIEDGGPGKNVLVRSKYVREDTGTHETLTIIDDSLVQADDDDGLDPYNTGRFDRSKSWDSSRSRK